MDFNPGAGTAMLERTDWIPRAAIILAQDEDRRFAPFDRKAQFQVTTGWPLDALFDEFATARRASLATLAGWLMRA